MSQPPKANVDPYGFEWPKDFNHELYDDFMSKYITVLSRRAKKWDRLLNSKEEFHKSNKVKRYVRKGIPSSHRGVVWTMISGAKELKDQQPDLYTTILRRPLKQEIIETIDLDIPRTFPDNIYFKTASPDSKRESLKNVLLAFAHQNPAIGYCQGLNFIAGIMLLVTDNEDMTFWLLQSLVERILPDFYTKEMTGLLTDIGVLEELIRSKVPQVHEHMVQTGVSWSMYVSKWFICLFAEVLPIETVLRIWDCLFYEGSKVLLRVAVTLVMKNQDKILAAKNFVEITEVFKSLPLGATVTECHSFMQAIFRVPGSFPRAHISKLREYCREKVEKEKAHTKVLQEQQKQRQLEEKKAREAALELKRQNEEKEAALQAEREKQALENSTAKELSPCNDMDAIPDENDSCKVQTKVANQKEEAETSNGNKSSVETNQIPNTPVITSFSTESIKQIANGKQTSPVAHEGSSKSPAEVSP
ncbi:hypothetical protein CDAR_303061 [Caerostris darwini]|uniref:Growth hormone-regulated TBC protein 1 n=1 Tax=Caerostris darwini TaxID=1538125 RepID=A0AAV4V448_9ARAC|nr:hypothetical protein CDAR_303061 [Caerostris darwini]